MSLRKFVVLAAMLASFVVAPQALAAPPTSVLGGDLTCGTVTAEGNVSTSMGQTWCGTQPASLTTTLDNPLPTTRSTHKAFDGVPLDVNFALPSTGAAPYPVVTMFHGYGGSKFNFSVMQQWLDKGYAVYSITQRGFGESCQSAGSQAADPTGCANGYVHLMDQRYEVRDTQDFLGELVDEGLISPNKIAATGGSYGGGMSMSLAALKDRKMMPNGTLVPWQSPNGAAMSLAVAVPEIPWTELSYALAPNGNSLDYIKDGAYAGRVGVMKESYVQGLSSQGRSAPAGQDPSADILGWKALLDAGEPYDGKAAVNSMLTEINTYHSSYGIPHNEPPAPLLISSGFTDDLFPVQEAVRFYNRTRAQYPTTPLSLFFGSFGHSRGQSQSNVSAARNNLEEQWVDYYLKAVGSQPASNVTTYTQTCPNGTAGGGPFTASDWASIAPGEIRIESKDAQTVSAAGGDTTVGNTFNPLTGGTTACSTAAGAKETGSADYQTDPAPAGGYTVMGPVTMVAKFQLPGDNSQIAARLVDVSPDGTTKTLIERGLWRPENSGFQVFQLFANGWHVDTGHVLRVELLPRDSAQTTPGGFLNNYGRPSDGQQDATVSFADIRIPVVESPGALGGLVKSPSKKVLPTNIRPGVELANGYGSIGSETLSDYTQRTDPCPAGTAGDTPPDCKPANAKTKLVSKTAKVKGKKLQLDLTCDVANASCAPASVKVAAKVKKAKGGKGKRKAKLTTLASGSDIQLQPGETKTVSLKLTGAGKKALKSSKKIKADVTINGDKAGKVTIKGKPKKKR